MHSLVPPFPLVGMQISLGEIARPAEQLEVRRVVGATEYDRHDVVDVVAGRDVHPAERVRAEHGLRDFHRLDIGVGVLAGRAALAVTAEALPDAHLRAVGLRVGAHPRVYAVSVLPAINLPLLGRLFAILRKVVLSPLVGLVSVLCVGRRLLCLDQIRVSLSLLGAPITMAFEALLALRHPLTEMPVHTGDACVVARQSTLARFIAGNDGNRRIAAQVLLFEQLLRSAVLFSITKLFALTPHVIGSGARNVVASLNIAAGMRGSVASLSLFEAVETLPPSRRSFARMAVLAGFSREVAVKTKGKCLKACDYLHVLTITTWRVLSAMTLFRGIPGCTVGG